VTYETREFSAVCPYNGLPDYAYLSIEYVPAQHVIELKSLKYYIVSFRNVGIFQENATARIYRDLHARLQPKRLCVKTVYNTRGGFDATCVIDSERQ
jgi:7-cyano-7-deazaguanine reductase